MSDNNQNNSRSKKEVNEHTYNLEDIPGMGEPTVKKLKSAGILSIRTLAIYPLTKLIDDAGIGEEIAQRIIRSAQEMEELKIRPRKASEVWEERKKMIKLTTGSREFDDSLGGGIEAGSLTELFGVFRTGKTQLCHQLCVNVQLPYEQGGLNGSAYYIDTENSFRPERIMQMALSLHLNYKEILDNIFICRAYNSDHQSLLIKEVHDFIPKFNIKLLVLDNIINHFLEEYDKKGKLEILRNTLRRHLRDLQMLLDVYPSLIIIFVNQVKNNTDVTPIIPLGGNIIAHASTTRIYLRKGKGEQRLAKIVKSPYISENEAVFSITENGIRD